MAKPDFGCVRRDLGSVRQLVQVAAKHGMDAAACLANTEIPLGELDSTSYLIRPSSEIAVIRNLLTQLGSLPGLGVEAGESYRLTDHGIWGFGLLSSASSRQATEFGIRFVELSYAFCRFTIDYDPDGVSTLTVCENNIPDDCQQFIVERDLVAAIALSRHFSVRHPPPRAIEFRFPRPVDTSPYIRALGDQVRFGCEKNRVIYDGSSVEEPLPQANEHTAMRCAEQCTALLAERRVRVTLSSQVQQRIADSSFVTSRRDIAKALGTSERSLRRHLNDEGTSFQRLLDETRMNRSEELLKRNLPVEEIATRVGYSEPASFIRAFNRWTGKTPSAFRSHLDCAGG